METARLSTYVGRSLRFYLCVGTVLSLVERELVA